jgi:hypothetical protein
VEEASAASRNTLDLSQVLMNQVAYFALTGEAPGESAARAVHATPTVALRRSPNSMRTLATADQRWTEF